MLTTKNTLKNYNVYFFFGVLGLVSVLTYKIFQPFITAILLAAILAVLFQSVYNFFLKLFKFHKSLSALATSTVILLLFIIPFTLVCILVGREVISAFQTVINAGDFYQNYVEPFVGRIHNLFFYQLFGLDQILSRDAFTHFSTQFGQASLSFVQSAYVSAARLIFLIFVTFFSLHYFFIDGKEIIKKLMYISPLRDAHEKILIERFVSISRASIKGNMATSFFQGLLGAATFFIAGVPAALTWGVAMMFVSMIPLFGSSIIWLPVSVILLVIGHIWQGVLVLIMGAGVISQMDNVLTPRLVGKDMQMHQLLIFFATIGGLAVYGFIGFILGPVIVALFVSLWDIYGMEFKNQLKRYNA